LDNILTVQRISIFPLAGIILLPDMQLPLHIFEPRYKALISDALARDSMIGIIQPKDGKNIPSLFTVGSLGRIGDVEVLDDGRYNIVLEGLRRFSLLRELKVSTPFRQVEGEVWNETEANDVLAFAERALLEREARKFSDRQGYSVNWNAVSQLDDYALVNVIAQIAPFDAAAKQALLETHGLSERLELLVQLMQFFGLHDGPDDRVTLQ
jgi:uncharacterized protein